jgi:hypothetical protein
MNGGFDHDQAGEADRKRAHGGAGYRRAGRTGRNRRKPARAHARL